MQFSALLLACGLGILALAYVLYPLYRIRLAKFAPSSPQDKTGTQSAPVDSEQAARLSLQEVELDYHLGNITESDYRTLRERYMRRVIFAMKARHATLPGEQAEPIAGQSGQTERESEIDRMIEEQLREMRESRRDDGGNEDNNGE